MWGVFKWGSGGAQGGGGVQVVKGGEFSWGDVQVGGLFRWGGGVFRGGVFRRGEVSGGSKGANVTTL